MKKILLVGMVLLFFPLVSATNINTYDAEIIIKDGQVVENIEVFLNYEGESSIKLFFPPSIEGLEIGLNNIEIICDQKEIFGSTEVTCPVEVESNYFLDITFKTSYPLVSLDKRELFTQNFIFDAPVNDFSLRIKLPERAVIPGEINKFVTPGSNQIYSDGRRIVLLYEGSDLEKLETSVIFEPDRSDFSRNIIILFVGVLLIVYSFTKRTKKSKEPLHLLPDEKRIIKILKNSKDAIRQKDIEKQVDFSKAKLSRTLRNLEERGIIKRIPKGNTNLITLRKR